VTNNGLKIEYSHVPKRRVYEMYLI